MVAEEQVHECDVSRCRKLFSMPILPVQVTYKIVARAKCVNKRLTKSMEKSNFGSWFLLTALLFLVYVPLSGSIW